MPKYAFPTVINDSILSTFGACPWKANLEYIEHWKGREESTHLVAGGAFASALEALRESYFLRNEPEEIAKGHAFTALVRHYGDHESFDDRKTLDRCLGALEFYCNKFPLASEHYKPLVLEGQSGVEFSFITEIPDERGNAITNPQTGEPLLYSGRMDQIVQDDDGNIFLGDDKTTTQLGATWSDKWRLRSQFTGYVFGTQQYGIQPLGVLIRGIAFYRAIQPSTGDLYDGRETVVLRQKPDIEFWLTTTRIRIRRLIQSWRTDEWERNLGDTCTSYGGCPFNTTGVCKASNPQPWIEQNFVQRVWDPVAGVSRPFTPGN